MPTDPTAGRTDGEATEILVAGTFDVQNYGDLLFPLIAAHELAPHGITVRACSPTNIDIGWKDTLPPLGAEAMGKPPFPLKGILVGGGNIIHLQDSRLIDYGIGDLSYYAYPSLWLGASIAGAVHNIPVSWNAPGVPHPLPERIGDHVLMRQLAEACEHFVVRDAESAANLRRAAPLAGIVPDTAVSLSHLWPKRTLAADFADLLDRKAAPRGDRYMTVHVKARSAKLPLPELAARIGAFAAAEGMVPVLLSLAPCHDDDITARHLGRFLEGPKVVVYDARGLREIAAAIAHADLHLGASMHGYVTAASYDVPSVLIAHPRLAKFEGFLGHTGREGDLVEEWDEAFPKAAALLREPATPRIPQAVRDGVKAHWKKVAAGFLAPKQSQLERSRFLRSYIRYCVEQDGWGWLLRPALDKSC
jgi:hypothetical protein